MSHAKSSDRCEHSESTDSVVLTKGVVHSCGRHDSSSGTRCPLEPGKLCRVPPCWRALCARSGDLDSSAYYFFLGKYFFFTEATIA